MVNVNKVLDSFRKQPGYTAMRGLARFPLARFAMATVARNFTGRNLQAFLAKCEARMSETMFPSIDRNVFLADLQKTGLAFGLKLPAEMVAEIRKYADEADTYADRDPALGFNHGQRELAEAKLGKTILVAQYYNTMTDSPGIKKLANDPLLQWVAAKYLGTVPSFFGSNLWWTFPVQASAEDRDRHAHVFHRDIDDFRFLKYFFYITDVPDGEGAHVCVSESNHNPPIYRRGDKYNIRRYSDDEVKNFYPSKDILTVCGDKGVGFAEDTLCIHKGSTPKSIARLMLHLQFGLFDYGTMNDSMPLSKLRRI